MSLNRRSVEKSHYLNMFKVPSNMNKYKDKHHQVKQALDMEHLHKCMNMIEIMLKMQKLHIVLIGI